MPIGLKRRFYDGSKAPLRDKQRRGFGVSVPKEHFPMFQCRKPVLIQITRRCKTGTVIRLDVAILLFLLSGQDHVEPAFLDRQNEHGYYFPFHFFKFSTPSQYLHEPVS